MTWYPQCAATPEEDGPNFEPAIIGPAFQRGQRRLLEAQAFEKVQREAGDFHERKARKYGVDHPVGLAHFKASRAYRSKEAAGRLQEMFDQNQSQIPPNALHKAHKAAVGFHKKAAEKAGLDSPEGQAHIAALQHHLGIAKTAKQQAQSMKQQKASATGYSGKQSPVPVPKKSEQPNNDIRQNKPAVPLKKLQQNKREAIDRFGEDEGGPGSGPQGGEKAGGGPRLGHVRSHGFSGYVHSHVGPYTIIEGVGPHGGDWMAKGRGEREIFDNKKDAIRHAENSGYDMDEARGPDAGTERHNPSRLTRAFLKDETDMFRAKKPRPASYGPKAAAGRVHDATRDRESFEGGPGSGPHKKGDKKYSADQYRQDLKLLKSPPKDSKDYERIDRKAKMHGKGTFSTQDFRRAAKRAGLDDGHMYPEHESRNRRSLW